MANMKPVVQGGTLKFQIPAHVGNISFITPPSSKVLAESKGIYKGSVQVQVAAGATDGSCTTTAPFVATFSPLAVKNAVENEKPLREDDTVIVSIPGVLSGGGSCTFIATVVIDDPGQTKVTMG